MPEQIPHYRFVAFTHRRYPRETTLIQLPDEVPADGSDSITEHGDVLVESVVAANEEHAQRRLTKMRHEWRLQVDPEYRDLVEFDRQFKAK